MIAPLTAAALALVVVAQGADPAADAKKDRAAELRKRLSTQESMSASMDEIDQKLTIFFRDAAGNAPLAGVKVTIDQTAYTTDARGRAIFPIPDKDAADFCLTAEKAGYAKLRASLALEGRTAWNPVFLMHAGDAGGAEACVKDIREKLDKKGASIDIHVNFETNQATLTALGKQQIDEIARAMMRILGEAKGKAARFRLIGHTDARGNAADNLDLSKRRAEAVRAYIAEKFPRVPVAVIDVEGKGKTQPIDKGTTEDAYAKNRRVEVKRVE